MTDYYTHGGYPAQSTPGASVDARTEFDAIATGFAKLAPYTGYAGRIVRINAGGTAQESVTLATATIESYADAQAGTHTLLGTVAGTNTITAAATPTLGAYITNQLFKMPAAAANTGATTLAIDGLPARNVVRPDGSALSANDILGANYECLLWARAADIVLLNPYTAGASKATPVGADTFAIGDSAAGGFWKTLSITNLFAIFGGLIAAATAKATPVGADSLLIADSAASNANKSLSFTNLVSYLSGLCSAGWNALTAANLSGTPALPNGTTATTQTLGDNTTKIATDAFVLANGTITGEVRQIFGTTAPSVAWYLIPNAAQAAVSRSGTYAGINTLMAALGYPFGAGDGSTTFVMPWIPSGYTWVQAVTAATAGALTHGKVKDHIHPYQSAVAVVAANSPGTSAYPVAANTGTPVAPEGGVDNLAAALGINYILKL